MTDKRIGDYNILKQIGAGGMAKVYLAVHKDVPNLKVVLKVLSDPRQGDRFKQEADKLALLDRHPHICKIKHFFNHGEELAIVMEYIEGPSLKEILKEKGRLPVSEALDITCNIISTLEPAHKQGIFHRDIKPGNIMFKESGQIKIIDFGIAKAKTDPSLTIAGTSAGTPDYMAPEQFDASEDIDYSKSDIYALGTMLFKMLTGELPFKGDNEFALRDSKMFEKPPNPSKLNKEISKDLSGIILKSIDKDPGKRFNSVGEMREKLLEIHGTCKTKERSKPAGKSEEIAESAPRRLRIKPKFIYTAAAAVIIAAASYMVFTLTSAPGKGVLDITINPPGTLYVDSRLIDSAAGSRSLSLEQGLHIIRVVNEKADSIKEFADTVQLASDQIWEKDYVFKLPAPEDTAAASGKEPEIQTSQRTKLKDKPKRESVIQPEPPVEKLFGSLRVSSKPPGGQIYIDGVLQVEKTPFEFTLPTGKHTAKVVINKDDKTFEHIFHFNIKVGECKKVLYEPSE